MKNYPSQLFSPCVFCLVLATGAGLAQEASIPPGKLYWIDRGTDEIYRSDFDGASPELLLNGDDVPGNNEFRGLAVDANAGVLFFCDNGADKIFRAPLDGTRVVTEIATDQDFPADITVDPSAAKIYWCERDGNVIWRANYDGSNPETVGETVAPYFLTLDVAGGKLYWGDFSAGNIVRVNLADGSQRETIVSGIKGQTRGVALDPVENQIYWVNRNDKKIQRRDLAGGKIEDIYTELDTPHGMVLDVLARKIYWADTGTNTGSGVGQQFVNRGDMEGGTPQEFIGTGGTSNDAWDIVLDTRPAAFSQWQARFFRKDRGANAGPLSDPDHDGLDNTLECVLGSHPMHPETDGPQPLIVRDQLGIEFLRQTGDVPGLAIAIEQSADL
ncbi:MAG: hypothetical protein O3C21_13415, partial [Verrucomicrobia bacterium]|nr:hypothetical protein [Verrucomicrobiota bacterium]